MEDGKRREMRVGGGMLKKGGGGGECCARNAEANKEDGEKKRTPQPPFLRVLNCEERAVPSFAGIQYSPRDQTRDTAGMELGGKGSKSENRGKGRVCALRGGRGEKSWGGGVVEGEGEKPI